jgi:hypothetical protein
LAKVGLRHDDKSKAYHCYNLVTQKIKIDKDVVFYEQFVGLQGLPTKQVANLCNKYNYLARIVPKEVNQSTKEHYTTYMVD